MLIAISGGIGSGKSIVARMLVAMGYDIYDCDSRARRLIDENISIKKAISDNLGACCIAGDDRLDRRVVGDIVFNNPDKLALLNSITHAAIREDIALWHKKQSGKTVFVETAILYQSEIDKMVDAVIDVTAPVDIRTKRVMQRNGLGYDEVMRRINSQNYIVDRPHPKVYTIKNDGLEAVTPQLLSILHELNV